MTVLQADLRDDDDDGYDVDLCDEASRASVVVSGAGDDAALHAPSPLAPTHQLYLRELIFLVILLLYISQTLYINLWVWRRGGGSWQWSAWWSGCQVWWGTL